MIVEPKPLVKRILKSSNKLEHVPGSGSHVEFKTATLSKKEKAALASKNINRIKSKSEKKELSPLANNKKYSLADLFKNAKNDDDVLLDPNFKSLVAELPLELR